ncbi:MAG: hypothetical protein VYB72_02420, partial [Planctomycetota bacterium]|nr:hypothetical protein [Planctomycetota bacterium]
MSSSAMTQVIADSILFQLNTPNCKIGKIEQESRPDTKVSTVGRQLVDAFRDGSKYQRPSKYASKGMHRAGCSSRPFTRALHSSIRGVR